MPASVNFANRLVQWQAEHGRHDLPWQLNRDPYRVWLSEVMLQQTQVQTVIAYFERFVQRFPDVVSLAQASLDEVMGLWSGLGYYSRARHLHACARVIVDQYARQFPTRSEELRKLPGIGPSTAAAIASICFMERVAILDGNVKRVLSRYLGFSGDLSQGSALQSLWNEAQRLLPLSPKKMPDYTQAVMDLGATLCVQRSPRCSRCPLKSGCAAHRMGDPERFPVKTRKLRRSAQVMWLVWLQNQEGSTWLQKRGSSGIWASLYCLPSFESEAAASQWLDELGGENRVFVPTIHHALTHRDLALHTVRATISRERDSMDVGCWAGPPVWSRLGLPAPIKVLLQGD